MRLTLNLDFSTCADIGQSTYCVSPLFSTVTVSLRLCPAASTTVSV